jgi:hypothetical protein
MNLLDLLGQGFLGVQIDPFQKSIKQDGMSKPECIQALIGP